MKENGRLKTIAENQNDEIKELEHSNKIKKEVSDKINRKLTELKVKFNNEKNEILRKHKVEVKYWKKELGEETKAKIKLVEKLQNIESPKDIVSKKSKIKPEVRHPSCNKYQSCQLKLF